ncbi:hypothetical protein O3P69_007070 [Scylla paramamosain]|uniref:Uncharacterized protein n=1 Tax=Scylla paramamosain TaxID=85552 RepID=A0AAW0V5D5_SCYPA
MGGGGRESVRGQLPSSTRVPPPASAPSPPLPSPCRPVRCLPVQGAGEPNTLGVRLAVNQSRGYVRLRGTGRGEGKGRQSPPPHASPRQTPPTSSQPPRPCTPPA